MLTRPQRRVILRGRGQGAGSRGHVTGLQFLVGTPVLISNRPMGRVACPAVRYQIRNESGLPQITSGTRQELLAGWVLLKKFLCHCVGYCRPIQYDSVPKTRNAFDGLARLLYCSIGDDLLWCFRGWSTKHVASPCQELGFIDILSSPCSCFNLIC